MESLVLLLITALISITSSTVNVVYLRGVPRLNNSTYWDYYYSCNTVGLTLQWQVNGNPLGGFLTGEVARILSSTRSNFDYTATLLASQPTTRGQSTFDSILIVSLLGRSSLDVECLNGPSFNSINNAESRRDVENKTNTSSIYLELLLTQPMVITMNYFTSVFVCGVDNQLMIWQVNTDIYAFTIFDSIGQSWQKQNDIIVKEQAILFAREPYQLVSVLFVMDTSDISVRCGCNQDSLELVSTTASEDPSTETDPEPITTVASSSFSGTEKATNFPILQYIVINVVVVSFMVLAITGAAVVFSFIVIRRKIRLIGLQPRDSYELCQCETDYIEKPILSRSVSFTRSSSEDESSQEMRLDL